MEDFINAKVKMIKDGFEYSEVREDVWRHILNKNCTSMRLDSIVDHAMQVYAEIVKRVNKE